MKKNKYKLTPQVYKELEALEKTLPVFQRNDKAGKPMSRRVNKVVKWKDLSPEQKLKSTNREKNPQDDDVFTIQVSEPILANHMVNLCEVYQQEGMPGVDSYAKHLYDAFETFKKIENEHRATN